MPESKRSSSDRLSVRVYLPSETVLLNFLLLYHTKNYQGTTTHFTKFCVRTRLYHTKNYQGTTTPLRCGDFLSLIIPYQELPGNYNPTCGSSMPPCIIPYQELPGNYNAHSPDLRRSAIIPYQELPAHTPPHVEAASNGATLLRHKDLPLYRRHTITKARAILARAFS